MGITRELNNVKSKLRKKSMKRKALKKIQEYIVFNKRISCFPAGDASVVFLQVRNAVV